jgi:fatty-acyl-CoA synthase
MATARAGLILVNVNPAFRSDELEYCLKKVGIKTLVLAESFKKSNYVEIVQ